MFSQRTLFDDCQGWKAYLRQITQNRECWEFRQVCCQASSIHLNVYTPPAILHPLQPTLHDNSGVWRYQNFSSPIVVDFSDRQLAKPKKNKTQTKQKTNKQMLFPRSGHTDSCLPVFFQIKARDWARKATYFTKPTRGFPLLCCSTEHCPQGNHLIRLTAVEFKLRWQKAREKNTQQRRRYREAKRTDKRSAKILEVFDSYLTRLARSISDAQSLL